MLTVVIGPPDCGKSAFAEDLAVKSGFSNRYYLATMKIMDEAGKERIKKHRMARLGKGFVTIEEPVDILSCLKEIPDPADSVVLLECMANLTGNLMFGPVGRGDVSARAIRMVRELEIYVGELIVVSSEYEPDAGDDEETADYKRALNIVNIKLYSAADKVYNMSNYKNNRKI